jgi:soluble P-type ATPase
VRLSTETPSLLEPVSATSLSPKRGWQLLEQAVVVDVDQLPPGSQDVAKLRFIERLDATRCAAVGNGRNDRHLLEAAALGVAVLNVEGTASVALLAADVVAPSIGDALDVLLNPLRLVASLSS